jgi:hypothetical protein
MALIPAETVAKDFLKPLIWLEWTFPAGFNQQTIGDTSIKLNCFPVANRRIDISRDFNADMLNTISLSSEQRYPAIKEHFVGIQRIWSNDNPFFCPLAYQGFDTASPGSYAVQAGDIGRFSATQASRMVAYLLYHLKENQSAFGAYERDDLRLSHVLDSIDNNIAELESLLNRLTEEEKHPRYYLHIRPTGPGMVFVRFWITQGDLRNLNIPENTILSEETPGKLQTTHNRLITKPEAGKDPLTETEKTETIRSLLISRLRAL